MLLKTLSGLAATGSADTARTEFETGNYSAAVKTATAALSQTPEDASLHFWALRSYYELQDYGSAVTHGERAVKLEPHNAEYHRWLGRAYGAKAEESRSFSIARKVKQAFEAAVHLAPMSIAARRDLMQFLAEAPWIVGETRPGPKSKSKRSQKSMRPKAIWREALILRQRRNGRKRSRNTVRLWMRAQTKSKATWKWRDFLRIAKMRTRSNEPSMPPGTLIPETLG